MRHRSRSDRGANLVEFAMVMPFLILLLLGIVEFSWTLATNLDVKQGAREGARLISVNFPDTGDAAIAAEICNRMDLVGSNPATTVSWASASPEVGEGVTVTVSTPHNTLTGLIDWAFGSLTDLDATVEIRIEQPPDWTAPYTQNCP